VIKKNTVLLQKEHALLGKVETNVKNISWDRLLVKMMVKFSIDIKVILRNGGRRE